LPASMNARRAHTRSSHSSLTLKSKARRHVRGARRGRRRARGAAVAVQPGPARPVELGTTAVGPFGLAGAFAIACALIGVLPAHLGWWRHPTADIARLGAETVMAPLTPPLRQGRDELAGPIPWRPCTTTTPRPG
jgi:hypothetical protein